MYYQITLNQARRALLDLHPDLRAEECLNPFSCAAPYSHILWMIEKMEKADRIINAAHAGRWVAYICACLEAKGLWTNVDTRHWIRMDVAAGNDGAASHSTLGFLSYSSNVCYVTGSTTPPDGVTVDLGAKTWSFRGETYAIGSERGGHRCHDVPIGVYDLSDPCQFRRMIHYAGEATDSHCDGLVED